MVEDCSKFLYSRYLAYGDMIKIERDEDLSQNMLLSYDILKWEQEGFAKPLEDYCNPNGLTYIFSIGHEQKKVVKQHLKRFSGLSDEYKLRKLQEPYHGMNKKNLLLKVECVAA